MKKKKTLGHARIRKKPSSRPARLSVPSSVGSGSPTPSVPPWFVPAVRLRFLTDNDLNQLMRALLTAEATRSGVDRTQVVVNAEENAGDEGCDGWTPKPQTSNPWLGTAPTCWQFKAGKAGEPSRLKGEVTKGKPRKTLLAGGRFVVVTSGSTTGNPGIEKREKILRAEAKKKRIPSSEIHVFSSESLETWINEHPAIAFGLRGVPPGIVTLRNWRSEKFHRDVWTPTDSLGQALADSREKLERAEIDHIHIFGPPGVGKTRFALEMCRDSQWQDSVLYAPQASSASVRHLLNSVVETPGTNVVLVIDEASATDAETLGRMASYAAGRIRIITIGQDPSPNRETIVEVGVTPLDSPTMTQVVCAWHPTMPREHSAFVAQFADGYVRLARMAAHAVAKDPSLDTSRLLKRGDIRRLLEAMLGNETDRRPLHVLAVLTSVGWRGGRAVEGETIAKHLGLQWTVVQSAVQNFHDRFNIAPWCGDLRYISPLPLGVYLMVEALEAYPDLIRTLPSVLPGSEARTAFLERWRAVAQSPQAKPIAEADLGFFFQWDHFLDPMEVERWAASSLANPAGAAEHVRRALQSASIEERKRIADTARRRLVWALVEICGFNEAFHDGALALAYLAEAENESWSNNASGEFNTLFQIQLGSTACPYIDRLSVIDELLLSNRPGLHRLAIQALALAGRRSEFRFARAAGPGAPPEPEWRPSSQTDYVVCVREALARLTRAAGTVSEDVASALGEAARAVTMLLREGLVRDAVTDFIRTVVKHHPTLREPIRRSVHGVMDTEKTVWKQLSQDDLSWIEAVHRELEDRSPAGRVREAVGPHNWRSDEDSLKSIAVVVVERPDILWEVWPWLTSGEAARAWDFGIALARVDPDRTLLNPMTEASGRGKDLRVVSGCIHERATQEKAGWVDDWLDEYEGIHPADVDLLLDVTWRCASTTRGAVRITRLVNSGRLAAGRAGCLMIGGWGLGPEIGALRELLNSLLLEPANRHTALALIDTRLSKAPQDLAALEDPALKLVLDGKLMRQGEMSGYWWTQLALRLVSQHARAIATVIFNSIGTSEDETWFLEHSEASKALYACAKKDPEAVWFELAKHLEDRKRAPIFSVGFPADLMNLLPQKEILNWVAVEPERRAAILARISSKSFAEGSLEAALLGKYGDIERVSNAFFDELVSGSWVGSISAHWLEVAARLEAIGAKAVSPVIRKWSREGVRTLRRMAETDRKREEERNLRLR